MRGEPLSNSGGDGDARVGATGEAPLDAVKCQVSMNGQRGERNAVDEHVGMVVPATNETTKSCCIHSDCVRSYVVDSSA